jgi:hypothetical protein
MYEKGTQSEPWKTTNHKQIIGAHMFKQTAKASMRGHLTYVAFEWWYLAMTTTNSNQWGVGSGETAQSLFVGPSGWVEFCEQQD